MNKMEEYYNNPIIKMAQELSKRMTLEEEHRRQVVCDLFDKKFVDAIRTGDLNALVPPTDAEIEAELEKRVTALMSE